MKWIIIIFSVMAHQIYAQQSPFNQSKIDSVDGRSYSFVVSGHFYGSKSNETHLPCNTILAEIDDLNLSDHSMLICLGDLFKDVKNDIPFYEKALFSKLTLPLFNTVGNHDLTGDIYQEHYGVTDYSFQLGNDLHLFIDTEKNDGDLDEDQLQLIREGKDVSQAYDNVFIYTHRTVWKDSYEQMDGLFMDNTQSLLATNFQEDVLPLLKELSGRSEVYWMSGSLGSAPASFFHDEFDGIHFMATSIRGWKRDALLIVEVQDGIVHLSGQSLTGEDLLAIEKYDADFWKDNLGASEPYNWRLLPLHIKNTVINWVFWIGALSCLIVVFIFNRIKKRRAAKPSA